MSNLKTLRTDDIARGNHVVPTEWAEQLERELNASRELAIEFHKDQVKLLMERDDLQKKLSIVHRWIDQQHPDGFIDSLSYLDNLDRVADHLYEKRIEAFEL